VKRDDRVVGPVIDEYYRGERSGGTIVFAKD